MILVGKLWANFTDGAGSWCPQRDLNSRRRRERPAILTINNNNDRLNPPKFNGLEDKGLRSPALFLWAICGQRIGE